METPTVGKIVSELMNQVRQTNADSRLTRKFVWSVIDTHSRWLIKRESSKLRIMRLDYLFQTIKCVEVIEVPSSDECCGIKTKCKIWRTKDKIPKMYTDEDGVIFKAVYSVDGSDEFTPIKLQEFMRKLENPHSKYDKSRYYYYNNGYLYFPNTNIKMVQIKAYFEDEVINECAGDAAEKKCMSNMDKVLRFPDYILGEIKSHAFQDLVNAEKVPTDARIDKDVNKIN